MCEPANNPPPRDGIAFLIVLAYLAAHLIWFFLVRSGRWSIFDSLGFIGFFVPVVFLISIVIIQRTSILRFSIFANFAIVSVTIAIALGVFAAVATASASV